MAFKVASLWQAPTVNPINNKAQSIPIFNPFNIYGRVFLLSWWSFFIAFWSWYAFPPLLTVTIKKDLQLSQAQISTSNILALTSTLIVRLTAGAACDRFGPRWTFVAILLAGAIPTALAGTVQSASGLIVLRFFIGILGGSFVPCQVWTTSFFDKNIVGTANALTAGWGNAGSGITYFVMPAIFDSLVQRQHLTAHTGWRVAFIVPFILITGTAMAIIFFCPDAPTGKWSSRAFDMQRQTDQRDAYVSTIDNQGKSVESRSVGPRKPHKRGLSDHNVELGSSDSKNNNKGDLDEEDFVNAASWELVEKPTYHGSVKAIISLPTLSLIVAYFCTFGTELAVNSYLGAYYAENFPSLGQTGSGRWAAMFGLLNAIFRPMGGMISDGVYRVTGSLWAKKMLMHSLAIILGVFMLIIGFIDPHDKAMMMGLVTGLAFFEEAGNGSVFSLVPHVHPTSNGLITGVTGAAGNLGGIVYLLILRYNGKAYAKVFWVPGSDRSPKDSLGDVERLNDMIDPLVPLHSDMVRRYLDLVEKFDGDFGDRGDGNKEIWRSGPTCFRSISSSSPSSVLPEDTFINEHTELCEYVTEPRYHYIQHGFNPRSFSPRLALMRFMKEDQASAHLRYSYDKPLNLPSQKVTLVVDKTSGLAMNMVQYFPDHMALNHPKRHRIF